MEYNDAGNTTVFYYARRLAQIHDALQYVYICIYVCMYVWNQILSPYFILLNGWTELAQLSRAS